jgi:hypothetical protein
MADDTEQWFQNVDIQANAEADAPSLKNRNTHAKLRTIAIPLNSERTEVDPEYTEEAFVDAIGEDPL